MATETLSSDTWSENKWVSNQKGGIWGSCPLLELLLDLIFFQLYQGTNRCFTYIFVG